MHDFNTALFLRKNQSESRNVSVKLLKNSDSWYEVFIEISYDVFSTRRPVQLSDQLFTGWLPTKNEVVKPNELYKVISARASCKIWPVLLVQVDPLWLTLSDRWSVDDRVTHLQPLAY